MSRYYDDEYESSNFEKFTNPKSKKHKKGHQSRSSNSERRQWEQLMEADIEVYTGDRLEPSSPAYLSATSIKVTRPASIEPTPNKTEHQFGDNTHEIKGVKIDFDGVDDIQKIENTKDGVTTYGIKFLFKGKKGLYRIVWYNTNFRARDAAYNAEYAFWLSIK